MTLGQPLWVNVNWANVILAVGSTGQNEMVPQTTDSNVGPTDDRGWLNYGPPELCYLGPFFSYISELAYNGVKQ